MSKVLGWAVAALALVIANAAQVATATAAQLKPSGPVLGMGLPAQAGSRGSGRLISQELAWQCAQAHAAADR
jgi:hypothetical protein